MSTQQGGGRIVTNGLSYCIDLFSNKSYDTTGSTLSDLSLNKLTSTIIGATFSQNSLLFNGTSDYVNVPASTKLSPRTGNLTTSAWFKTTDSPAANSNIISNYPPSLDKNFYGIYLQVTGYILGYLRDGSNNAVPITTTVVVNDGKWHNVVLVRNGTSGSIYIDGNLINTSTNASLGDINLDTNSLNIGRNSASNGQYFKGNIQTVYYYNRALTDSEILQNYKVLKSRFGL
jgi:hypothetical protein